MKIEKLPIPYHCFKNLVTGEVFVQSGDNKFLLKLNDFDNHNAWNLNTSSYVTICKECECIVKNVKLVEIVEI